jgi:lysozyme family protein
VSLAFEHALAIMLGNEGGFSNNPDDRGGKTQWGVTQATYRQYYPGDVQSMTPEQAKDIYFRGYWEPAHCEEFPLNLATIMFDAAVNHGPKRAIRLLQQALNLHDDGLYGPETQKALQEDLQTIGEPELIRECLARRHEFYLEIIARDTSQLTFERGWLNRLDRLARLCVDHDPSEC